MAELCFKSSLSLEEIEANFKDADFFTGIMDGLQEALAYKQRQSSNEAIAIHGATLKI